MKQAFLAIALAALTLPVCADEGGTLLPPPLPGGVYTPEPLQRPSHTDRYVIDAGQSFVKAYVPVWEKADGPLVGSVGEAGAPTDSYWVLNWRLETYGLSGSFDLETVYSDWNRDRSQLRVVRQAEIVSDVPAHAGFALPAMFAKLGQSLTYIGNPCFDHDFTDPPGWTSSCSGWVAGPIRSDSGTQLGRTISIDGSIPAMAPFFGLPEFSGPQPPDRPVVDQMTGVFEYHLVAVSAVPEPQTYAMFLAGVLAVGIGAGRRRKTLAANSV